MIDMPAITVENPLTLPVVAPAPAARARPVRSITTAPRAYEGDGFPVRRAFAGVSHADLDPFVHLDQMGEVDYKPGEPKGTPWHPHRGFETVTYIIDGEFVHRDSHGGGGRIKDGDTQWMTAGSGILHIEVPPDELIASGGLFHGLQLWVNLPSASKMVPPRYQDLRASETGLGRSADAGTLVRVIAGSVGEVSGPGQTYTPITLVHATMQTGSIADLPWDPEYNALVYALAGSGTVGDGDEPFHEGQLAVLGAGDTIHVRADDRQDSRTGTLELYIMGGLPIREPVVQYGPFVMNTKAEIAQAFQDYEAGKLGSVPA
jgi:redox-sensitive bicupin YhaK (pirin superfamily)